MQILKVIDYGETQNMLLAGSYEINFNGSVQANGQAAANFWFRNCFGQTNLAGSFLWIFKCFRQTSCGGRRL